MSEYAFKFLARGAVGAISECAWPRPFDGRPGAWIDAAKPLQLCTRGVHVCQRDALAHWLHEELWVVEIDGERMDGIDCVLVERARLVREVDAWSSGGGAARFAKAARDHAAELVTAAPAALQPRLTQYIADSSWHLPNGSTALAAFCAAMAVAWIHGGDHFDLRGYRLERAWQSAMIARDLEL